MAVRTGAILNIEELDSKEIVEKVAKAITKNRSMEIRHDNTLFYIALKEAGLDAYEILREASRKLIENTKKKTREHPPISTETIFTWLSSWREYVGKDKVEAKATQRLLILKGILEGRYWISQIGQNLVVITDGHSRFTITKGSIH